MSVWFPMFAGALIFWTSLGSALASCVWWWAEGRKAAPVALLFIAAGLAMSWVGWTIMGTT